MSLKKGKKSLYFDHFENYVSAFEFKLFTTQLEKHGLFNLLV